MKKPAVVNPARIVGIGDSYTSGVGGGDYTGGACLVSSHSWPAIIATDLHISNYMNVACAAATIPSTSDQITHITRGTTPALGLMTIGGNDAGFSSSILACLGQECAQTLTDQLEGNLATLYGLPALYRQAVRALGPGSRLMVVGYPRLFGTDSTSSAGACPAFNTGAKVAMDASADAIDSRIKQHVAQARKAGTNVQYVDVRAAFQAHGACSQDPWLNAPVDVISAFHPNITGYTQISTNVSRALAGK